MHPLMFPAITFSLFIVVGGLVILLHPISRRLGSYLEVLIEQRRRELGGKPLARDDMARITTLLESLDQRLAQVEERQEFTEQLLAERTPRSEGVRLTDTAGTPPG